MDRPPFPEELQGHVATWDPHRHGTVRGLGPGMEKTGWIVQHQCERTRPKRIGQGVSQVAEQAVDALHGRDQHHETAPGTRLEALQGAQRTILQESSKAVDGLGGVDDHLAIVETA